MSLGFRGMNRVTNNPTASSTNSFEKAEANKNDDHRDLIDYTDCERHHVPALSSSIVLNILWRWREPVQGIVQGRRHTENLKRYKTDERFLSAVTNLISVLVVHSWPGRPCSSKRRQHCRCQEDQRILLHYIVACGGRIYRNVGPASTAYRQSEQRIRLLAFRYSSSRTKQGLIVDLSRP